MSIVKMLPMKSKFAVADVMAVLIFLARHELQTWQRVSIEYLQSIKLALHKCIKRKSFPGGLTDGQWGQK